MPDHLEAELVGPVEVLEDGEHGGPGADRAEGVGEVLDQQPPLRCRSPPTPASSRSRADMASPTSRSPASGDWRRSLARSSSSPPEVSVSPGNAVALTTPNVRRVAASLMEASRRVLPIPASPATNSSWPRPLATSASLRSARGEVVTAHQDR